MAKLNAIYGGESPTIRSQPEGKGLFWGARNIFVANVWKDVETSLLAVHRLYYSHVRHILYLWDEERVTLNYLTPEMRAASSVADAQRQSGVDVANEKE